MHTIIDRTENLNVHNALMHILEKRLGRGWSVDLRDLCILSGSISRSKVENKEDLNTTALVKKAGVNIRPKKNLLEAMYKTGKGRA